MKLRMFDRMAQLLSVIAVIALSLSAVPAAALPNGAVPLFEAGGGRCYRIPAIVSEPSGLIIALSEERLGRPAAPGKAARWEDCPDWGSINIVSRVSKNGGAAWSEKAVVVDHSWFLTGGFKVALAGNPTIVPTGKDNEFLVIFAVSRTKGIYNSTSCIEAAGEFAALCQGVAAEHGLWTVRTTNGGSSWSEPKPLQIPQVQGFIRPGPGNGIRLPTGRLVVPAYGQLLLSDDSGKTWRAGARTGSVKGFAGSETTVVADRAGMLWSSARLTQASYAKLSKSLVGVEPSRISGFSADGGETYQSVMLDTRFPTSPIQTSATTAGPDDTVYVAFPYSAKDPNGRTDNAERRRLTVCALDKVDGLSSKGRVIEEDSSSYSGIARIGSDKLGILFEAGSSKREKSSDTAYTQAIWFAALPLSWLQNGKDQANCRPPQGKKPLEVLPIK